MEPAQLVGRRACVAPATAVVRLELVFGLSRKGKPDLTQGEWLSFLDAEVTPRFPKGLTVLSGSGQWRSSSGSLVSEPSRVLLVWIERTPDLDQRIEDVRVAWKRAHAQESVLRAESSACVSF